MIWACEHDGCPLEGMAFSGDYTDAPACQSCGTTMTDLDELPVPPATTPAPTAAPLTSDELMTVIRSERDDLLRGCDWTQLPDSPLDTTTKTAWQTYRQQLRDYPDQTGFDPTNPPAWPTPPA